MKKIYFLIVLTAAVMSSCLTDPNLSNPQKEIDERIITDHLSAAGITDAVKTPSGLFYQTLLPGSKEVELGSIVEIDYSLYLLNGLRFAKDSNHVFQTSTGTFMSGISEGVFYMKAIGESRFFVPSTLAFGSNSGQLNGVNIPANAVIRADVKLRDVRTEDQQKAEENRRLIDYILANKLKVTDDTLGIYFCSLKAGTGAKITNQDFVNVAYKGSLLNGTVFDTNSNFSVDMGGNNLIKGWLIGMLMMHKGEKGLLLIPSHLAYGPSGTGAAIGPFQPLVFEIEIL